MIPIAQNTYLVEVKLPATIAVGTQINFGFIAQLDGAEIYGIESLATQDIGSSPNQNFTIDIAGLPSLLVTFVVGEQEDLYQLPITDLNYFFNKGITRSFNKLKIDFTKSYLTIVSTVNILANESICFNFIYKK
jgi:hypothetical protein